MRRVGAAFLALVVVTGVGCSVLVGSTDGYTLFNGSCMSAADCPDGGGVCCFSASASTLAMEPVGSCAPTCTVSLPQLCKTTAECGQAGPCSLQTCDAGAGMTGELQACGNVCGAPGAIEQ